MPDKSVALSVRLSADDAAYLAEYEFPGVTTLSEKLRTIIAESRQRRAGSESYSDSLRFTEGLVAPVMLQLREVEALHGEQSELLHFMGQWLPETLAVFLSGKVLSDKTEERKTLVEFEASMADRVFALMEQVLRLGVTGDSPCYDPQAVVRRASSVVKLSEIIKDATIEK